MDINEELDKVLGLLKNSVGELQTIKKQSFEIPVDFCSKKWSDSICWPNTGDKIKDIFSLVKSINCDLDVVRSNLVSFQHNKFQVIKEEDFTQHKYNHPLQVDYEIIQSNEEKSICKLKKNATKLQKQLEAFYKNIK